MNAHVDPNAAHAVYAPSGVDRWEVCTASAEAIAKLPEREEGEEAAEGTRAHDEIDRCLKPLMDGMRNDPRPVNPDHPAAYGIALVIDYVRKLIRNATVDDRIWIEQRVFLTDQIWGRCDVSHWHAESRTLTIVDYKNGYVGVDEGAPQLRIYAAASMFTHKLPVKWVRYAIVQPNDFRPVPRVKQWKEPVETLYEWAERVAAIPKGTKKFVPGEQCTYCPLFGVCQPTKDLLANVGALVAGLMSPKDVTPEQRALFMACEKPIKDAFSNAQKAWLKEALKDNAPPPGLEIVTGQKHRVWLNEAEARAAIVAAKGTGILKLPTPAQAEEMGIDVSALADKPEGGPVLAFASDKRPKYRRKTSEEMFGRTA